LQTAPLRGQISVLLSRGAANTSGATIAKRRRDRQQASPSASLLTRWIVDLSDSLFKSTPFLRGGQL